MENNKEELRKLETKYNKYMKIVKIILLIILFAILILLFRFVYLFYLHYNIIYHGNSGALANNCKRTSTTFYQKNTTDKSTFTANIKNGSASIQYADNFILYQTSDKIYHINPIEKTYCVHDNESENFEDYSFAKKFSIVCVVAYNGLTDTIRYEQLENTKYLTITSGNTKAWYNKDTFLLEKREGPTIIEEYSYEFDVVTDEDIAVPDLSEYTLVED